MLAPKNESEFKCDLALHARDLLLAGSHIIHPSQRWKKARLRWIQERLCLSCSTRPLGGCCPFMNLIDKALAAFLFEHTAHR